jgi:hypothetical protein
MAAVRSYCYILSFCDNNQWAVGSNTYVHVIPGQYLQVATFMYIVGRQPVVALPGSVIGPSQVLSLPTKN